MPREAEAATAHPDRAFELIVASLRRMNGMQAARALSRRAPPRGPRWYDPAWRRLRGESSEVPRRADAEVCWSDRLSQPPPGFLAPITGLFSGAVELHPIPVKRLARRSA